MEQPILKITPKKYVGESSVISMRIPKDMIRDIDRIAASTGRTRNELLTLSLEFVLNHIEVVTESDKSK